MALTKYEIPKAPTTNLLLQKLLFLKQIGRLSAIEEAGLEFGRPYVPRHRPKGFRQRAPKQCYFNAGDYATRDPPLGTYVEGFACSKDQPPFQHAWLTLDGKTAIDVTLRSPESYQYFGVEVPSALVAKLSVIECFETDGGVNYESDRLI